MTYWDKISEGGDVVHIPIKQKPQNTKGDKMRDIKEVILKMRVIVDGSTIPEKTKEKMIQELQLVCDMLETTPKEAEATIWARLGEFFLPFRHDAFHFWDIKSKTTRELVDVYMGK